jgi:iron complex transport system permease protein
MAEQSLRITTRRSAASDTLRLNLGVKPALLLTLAVVVAALFVLALAVGSVHIPLDQIATVLLGGEAERASWTGIILKVRLPRAITAVLAGAALSVAGLMMQTFFRNPLADPFILGVSSGASLGVALVVLSMGAGGSTFLASLGLLGDFGLAFAASIGAALTMLIVLQVARRVTSATVLLVLGLMFAYFTGALVNLLLHFAVPERVQAYVSWGFGSFSAVTWDQLLVLAPAVLAALVASMLLAKPLNALLLGETYARSMGLNVGQARVLIVVLTGVLAGAVTAFCGPIGFVGVAVPHVTRILVRASDHRMMIPATALVGAIAALLAAMIAEMPFSTTTLPLNAVTALFGAPIVMAALMRSGRRAF